MILTSKFGRRKRIQGFIFNWKGHEANALSLQKKIADIIKVTVINSDQRLQGKHEGWIDLDDTAYFSAQWNKASQLFDADLLFHIQADAEFDQFELLIPEAELMFERHGVGVYEPNVNHTDIQYDQSSLEAIEPGVLKIPMTDCTCWFIDGALVRKLPLVDLSVNQFGWGIPRAIAALCWLSGMVCVRDYNFTIRHPKGRGYSSQVAMQQKQAYVKSLGPELSNEILRLEQMRTNLSLNLQR